MSEMSITVQEAVVSTSNWPSISTCRSIWPTQAACGLPVSGHSLKPEKVLDFPCASITVLKVQFAFEVALLQPSLLLPGTLLPLSALHLGKAGSI